MTYLSRKSNEISFYLKVYDDKKYKVRVLLIRDILVRIRIRIRPSDQWIRIIYTGKYTLTSREENYRFNPSFYTSRQFEETVGEPGEVIISSLYKEVAGGEVFVLPATEGEQQQQQQHHVEFVIPTTCEQVVEVEVEYPS
jgi:hypothetical protein